MAKRVRPEREFLGGYVPVGEVAKIDAYAKKLSDENGGIFVSRTQAMRALINLGLHAVGMASEKGAAVSS